MNRLVVVLVLAHTQQLHLRHLVDIVALPVPCSVDRVGQEQLVHSAAQIVFASIQSSQGYAAREKNLKLCTMSPAHTIA